MKKIFFIFAFFIAASTFAAILPYPVLSNHTNITETDAYKINNYHESEIAPTSSEEVAVLDLDFSVINSLLPAGSEFRLCDIQTCQVFSFVRTGGENHADVELSDDEDPAIFFENIALSWQRRPVVVQLNDKTFLPASLSAYPHGYSTNSNLSGHMCLHFSGSKTDGTKEEDYQHQKAVRTAKKLAKNYVQFFE